MLGPRLVRRQRRGRLAARKQQAWLRREPPSRATRAEEHWSAPPPLGLPRALAFYLVDTLLQVAVLCRCRIGALPLLLSNVIPVLQRQPIIHRSSNEAIIKLDTIALCPGDENPRR